MRSIICLLMAVLLVPVAPAPQVGSEPFVPAGVWYGGGAVQPPMTVREPAKERDAWRRELAAIKALGFNSITGWVDWASAEPARGRYDFEALDQLLSLAGESDLEVIVHVYTDTAPAWLGQRYTDARFIGAESKAATGARGFCPDHPGVGGDRLAFIGAAIESAARHPSFYAVELRSDPFIKATRTGSVPSTTCTCPHTTERLRQWAAARSRGDGPIGAAERRAFSAEKRQADLKLASDTARSHGARLVASYSRENGVPRQEEWRLADSVDGYGSTIVPKDAAPAWSPVALMSVLEAMRSAFDDRGWWLGELQGAEHAAALPVSAADVRLWGWAAYSRGARAISYTGLAGAGSAGLTGSAAARARAAGELAGNLTRNVRLFAPMRARPSQVAVVLDGDPALDGAAVAFYRLMFEQNIQVDFISAQEMIAGAGTKYRVIHHHAESAPAPVVKEALEAFVRGGGTVVSDGAAAIGKEEARVQRSVAAAGVTPDIRIDGAPGLVEARFLESSDALLLVALNHASTPQTVTMHFTAETPEAIWQNMESGSAVHFVQAPEGPTYRHTFAARDVMILVRGKRLR